MIHLSGIVGCVLSRSTHFRVHTWGPDALFGGRENVIGGIFEKLKAVKSGLDSEVG